MSAPLGVPANDGAEWYRPPARAVRDMQFQLLLWSLPGSSPVELTPEAIGCLRLAIDTQPDHTPDPACTETASRISAALAVLFHAVRAAPRRL